MTTVLEVGKWDWIKPFLTIWRHLPFGLSLGFYLLNSSLSPCGIQYHYIYLSENHLRDLGGTNIVTSRILLRSSWFFHQYPVSTDEMQPKNMLIIDIKQENVQDNTVLQKKICKCSKKNVVTTDFSIICATDFSPFYAWEKCRESEISFLARKSWSEYFLKKQGYIIPTPSKFITSYLVAATKASKHDL